MAVSNRQDAAFWSNVLLACLGFEILLQMSAFLLLLLNGVGPVLLFAVSALLLIMTRVTVRICNSRIGRAVQGAPRSV